MEINICHMYPDLLNIYGDVGNILILKYRAKKRGIKTNVFNVSINDDFDSSKYDIVFFGGGQDYEQSIVANDLKENKRKEIIKYIENNKVFLSICGGYQLLGKYYITGLGKEIEGLSALNVYTEPSDKRFIGNTVIYNNDYKEFYVGFENHSGKTYIGDLKPLGKVLSGYGNNGEDGYEGCVYKNTYCTYFHGSLLSKNPELADRLLMTALKNKYKDFILPKLDDTYELKAKKFIINREILQ